MRIGILFRTVNTHRERVRWESRWGGLFHGYVEQPSPAKAFVVHVRSFICETVKGSNEKGGIGRRPTLDLDGRRVAARFHDAAKENGDVFYLAFGEDGRMLTSEIRPWLGRGWNLCEENMVLIVLVIFAEVLATYPDDMICQIGERRDNVQVQDELWRRHDLRSLWLILTYWKKMEWISATIGER